MLQLLLGKVLLLTLGELFFQGNSFFSVPSFSVEQKVFTNIDFVAVVCTSVARKVIMFRFNVYRCKYMCGLIKHNQTYISSVDYFVPSTYLCALD